MSEPQPGRLASSQVYFPVLLGVWKMLGAIAILLPRFPLFKEWDYAEIFFDLTGAVVASAAP